MRIVFLRLKRSPSTPAKSTQTPYTAANTVMTVPQSLAATDVNSSFICGSTELKICRVPCCMK